MADRDRPGREPKKPAGGSDRGASREMTQAQRDKFVWKPGDVRITNPDGTPFEHGQGPDSDAQPGASRAEDRMPGTQGKPPIKPPVKPAPGKERR